MTMKHRRYAFAAALLAAAMLASGCTKGSDPERSVTESAAEPAQSRAETTESSAAPETTVSESSADTETTEDAQTTAPEESSQAESSRTDEESSAAPRGNGTVKILWSERGLEAVAADSEDGYGEELRTGAEYLDWTLNSFSGTAADVEADFSYDGELTTNGILTVLASSHADYPNGLYLRADNQADFPYFPKDTRERGKFIIENAAEVYEMLGLDDPPVSSEYTVAVTVAVTSLHVHCTPGGYDTVKVTSASRR
jgi:hypothetical protein